jgi:hypothetical protein
MTAAKTTTVLVTDQKVAAHVLPSGLPDFGGAHTVDDTALDRFDDASLDAVLISGVRDYEQYHARIRRWRQKLKRGGILVGDGHSSPLVRIAVEP